MSFLSKTLVTAGKPEEAAIEKWLEAKGGKFGKQGGSGWSQDKEFWSYKTVIAKIKGNTLYVNSTKYSKTTSKLTENLKRTGEEKGFDVKEKDEAFFKTSMPEKLPSGYRPGKS